MQNGKGDKKLHHKLKLETFHKKARKSSRKICKKINNRQQIRTQEVCMTESGKNRKVKIRHMSGVVISKAKHTIIREKHSAYSLNCDVLGRTWPFNLPTQRVVFICPLCNKINLDIQPIGKDYWIIHENYLD